MDLTVDEVTTDTRIVVVDVKNQNIGVIVDGVDEVLRIKADSIEPTSSIITATNSDYILGIAKLEDRLIILLDLENALSEEALEIGRQEYLQEKSQKALNPIEAVLEEIVSKETEDDEVVSENGEPLEGRATLSVFYGRLLTAYPEIKPFFAEMNMKEAGTDLMEFLNPILDNLARPSGLNEAMQALYEYHNDRGIRPEHHPLIGDTLKQMVSEYLGIGWLDEFEETWVEQYNSVIGVATA